VNEIQQASDDSRQPAADTRPQIESINQPDHSGTNPLDVLTPPARPEEPHSEQSASNSPQFSRASNEPRAVRPELFRRLAEPWVLYGRQDVASFLYYGGLSSTGYCWRDISMKIFERSGYHSEVHSLAGHDGEWQHFKETGRRAWIDDIVRNASRLDNPVFLGYSTSALAAIVAAAENPGLFKGLVLAAPPLDLFTLKHKVALNVTEFISRCFPRHFGWTDQMTVSMGRSDFPHQTKQMRKGPHFREIPVPVVIELRRLQREALLALKKIDVPIFILQGASDQIVSGKTPGMLMQGVASTSKTCKIYPLSNHSLLVGANHREILHDLCNWLRDECLPALAVKEPLPDFHKRLTSQAAAGLVMGTIMDRFRRQGLLPGEDGF
jgi:esterase/lipase